MNTDLSSQYFIDSGTLGSNVPSYVKRAADEELFNAILSGEYCNVLTTRQMGKSSLMVRTSVKLKEQNFKTVIVDMQGNGSNIVREWYGSLFSQLQRGLHLSVEVDEWIDKRDGKVSYDQMFKEFIKDEVASKVSQSVVIFIDELDWMLKLSFKDNFFAVIRSLYNSRAFEPDLRKITFVLLGVASPNDLITDISKTPYNIGVSIALQEFTLEEAYPLVNGLKSVYPDTGEEIFKRIFYWTDGHPHLTQKLCKLIYKDRTTSWTNEAIDELVQLVYFSSGTPREINLRSAQEFIIQNKRHNNLLKLYIRILSGNVQDSKSNDLNTLKLSGLVTVKNNKVKARNLIYLTVFDEKWAKGNIKRSLSDIEIALLIFVIGVIASGWIYFEYDRKVENLVSASAKNFNLGDSPFIRVENLAAICSQRNFINDMQIKKTASSLYFSLDVEERIELFSETVSIEEYGDYAVEVINCLYDTNVKLEDGEDNSQLIREMHSVLSEKMPESQLTQELEYWVKAREAEASGERASALSYYNQSLILNPDNPAILYERALTLIKSNEIDMALQDIEKLLNIIKQAQEPSLLVDIKTSRDNFAIGVYIQIALQGLLDSYEIIETTINNSPDRYSSILNSGLLVFKSSTLTLEKNNLIVAGRLDGADGLYLLDIKTNTISAILSNFRGISSVALSPDGEKIVFEALNDEDVDIYVLNIQSGQVINLTNSPGKDGSPSWSFDSSKIAFESFRDGNFEIYMVNADGSNPIRLTNDPAPDVNPIWSPIENKIVFVSTRFGNSDLLLLSFDGSVSTLTTSSLPDNNPRWSPDGNKISFNNYSGELSNICIINSNGLEQNCISSINGDYGTSNWSPNGEMLAYIEGDNTIVIYQVEDQTLISTSPSAVSFSGILTWSADGKSIFIPSSDPKKSLYIINVDLASVSRLNVNFDFIYYISLVDKTSIFELPTQEVFETPTKSYPNIQPELNSNSCGNWLLFHTFRDDNLEIYRLDGIEGQPEAKLYNISDSDGVDSRPSRSPDGNWIVFQSNREGNVELFLADSFGKSSVVRLTNSQANNFNAMYAADSSTILFQSDRNGRFDLYTIDQITLEEIQITSNLQDDINGYFSPNPRYLVFQSNRNDNWDIFILDLETTTEFQLTNSSADEFFPSWSPGGNQISFLLAEENGAVDLYVFDLGSDEIKRLTTDGKTTNAIWSPDGSRIAYQSERNGNLDVYVFSFKENLEYRVTDNESIDSGPSWDCDGEKLAFTSARDGNPNIFQVFWQGGTESNITINPATDKWPQWSPPDDVSSNGY